MPLQLASWGQRRRRRRQCVHSGCRASGKGKHHHPKSVHSPVMNVKFKNVRGFADEPRWAALVVGCLIPPLLHLLFRLISSSLDSGAVRADQSNIKRGGPGDAEYQALGEVTYMPCMSMSRRKCGDSL